MTRQRKTAIEVLTILCTTRGNVHLCLSYTVSVFMLLQRFPFRKLLSLERPAKQQAVCVVSRPRASLSQIRTECKLVLVKKLLTIPGNSVRIFHAIHGGIAQLARACGSYPQCPEFKSLCRHHRNISTPQGVLFLCTHC